jgi:myo-inositol-1(or 4)-monophosphatase
LRFDIVSEYLKRGFLLEIINENTGAFIKKTILGAGEIIMDYYSQDLEMKMKSEIDPVTIADMETEQYIVDEIVKKFPDHSILAEERPEIEKESDYLWVIDPLDGTTNYAHHFPLFCVSIALHHKGKPLVGAIYEPVRDELFYAEKDRGATLNDEPIKVSDNDRMKRAFLSTGFAYDVHSARDDNVDNFRAFLKTSLAIRRGGSAALDLAYVACGRFDGFWEMKLHPWDTAAGILIVSEAGGKISRFNGDEFSIYNKDMLATNTKIHDEMIDIIQSVKDNK